MKLPSGYIINESFAKIPVREGNSVNQKHYYAMILRKPGVTDWTYVVSLEMVRGGSLNDHVNNVRH
jgi:hypothetical protein